MQRAEMEELRQRDANLTALQAIGPRKKPKLEEGTATPITVSDSPPRRYLNTKQPDSFLAWCLWTWRCQREGVHAAPTTHQAGEPARYALLPGTGKGKLQKSDAVQSLPQVIDCGPTATAAAVPAVADDDDNDHHHHDGHSAASALKVCVVLIRWFPPWNQVQVRAFAAAAAPFRRWIVLDPLARPRTHGICWEWKEGRSPPTHASP